MNATVNGEKVKERTVGELVGADEKDRQGDALPGVFALLEVVVMMKQKYHSASVPSGTWVGVAITDRSWAR